MCTQDAREPGAERVSGGAGQSPEAFRKHHPGNSLQIFNKEGRKITGTITYPERKTSQ